MATEVDEKANLVKKVMDSKDFDSEEKLQILKALMKEENASLPPYEKITYIPYQMPYEPMKVWYETDPYYITCNTPKATTSCEYSQFSNKRGHRR